LNEAASDFLHPLSNHANPETYELRHIISLTECLNLYHVFVSCYKASGLKISRFTYLYISRCKVEFLDFTIFQAVSLNS